MSVAFKILPALQLHKEEIIIFDETNSSLIKKIIPEVYSCSIYKTRPVEIVVTFKIIFNFFLNFKHIKIFEQYNANKGFFKNILWQILCIYIKSYIQIVKPKAIITSIDKCTKFAWLSKHIQEIPFIAIQNGFRLSSAQDNSLYHCQHLFCFGDFEVENFPKREWTVNNFYPVGSVFASMHFQDKYEDKIDTSELDILVVSCWRGNIGFEQDVQDSMKAMRLFDLEFAAYLRKRNLKAAVILRSERDSEHWFMPEMGVTEEEYFKSIYEDNINIIETDFSLRNIYPLMAISKLIIAGFGTTALLEAFGVGKKILYCDFTYQNKYFSDFNKEILFTDNKDSPALIFSDKLDELLDISSHEYKKRYSSLMKFYQYCDENAPAQEMIRDKIIEILNIDERH